MSETSKVICSYEDSFRVNQTKTGLVYQETGDLDVPDVPLTEVYRFYPGEYENKDISELEEIVHKKNIEFDVCGELDDCSGYVFWKFGNRLKIIVRNGSVTDIRLPGNMELNIEVLEIRDGCPDYEKLKQREDALYEDSTMYSADFTRIS